MSDQPKTSESRLKANKKYLSKFAYIKKNYSTQDIRELWSANKQMTLANEVEFLNQKAYDAMKDFIEEKNAFSMTITTRNLLQSFSEAPYGWLEDDILYILARLLKDEVVSLYYSNEIQNITSEDTLNKILSERTGQPLEKIQMDTERDNFMEAREAKEYGLIDEVISERP